MAENEISETPSGGHSANVRLLLHVDHVVFDLADVGPQNATLRHPAKVRGGKAVLEIVTDGRSHQRNVTVSGSNDVTQRVEFVVN